MTDPLISQAFDAPTGTTVTASPTSSAFAPPFALVVDGTEYAGWQSLRVTRGLTRATSDFDLTVSERWGIAQQAWQILPGAKCEIRYKGETLLTGWVDTYTPSYDATQHTVRLAGRSKTCDFVDCSVLVDGGQFLGMTVGDIAKQLAKPYSLDVNVLQDGKPEAEVQVQQGETCFALVERLSRLQALLVTDDAQGRLVLTRAGSDRATTQLRHGDNVLAASSTLDQSKRYSECLVKAQRPGNSNKSQDDAPTTDPWPGVTPAILAARAAAFRLMAITNSGERHKVRRAMVRDGTTPKRGNPTTLTQVNGRATDPQITRYRPLVIVAEAQSDDGMAQTRADWEMRRRKGEGTKATVTVNGFRQQDGTLWQPNMMVQTDLPWLAVDRELLISEVTYSYDDGGEKTTLALTLPDAFLPDPKQRKAKAAAPAPAGTPAPAVPDPWADVAPIKTGATP
jgi:prophage tail gpP-like protein